MPGFVFNGNPQNPLFTMNDISVLHMTIPPQTYNPQARVEMQLTLTEVLRKFNKVEDYQVRDDWKSWMAHYCPRKENVDLEDYIIQIASTESAYNVPLDNIILRKRPMIHMRKMSEESISFSDSSIMRYYSDNYYNATPSVVTRFTRHPPPPRVPSTNNSLLAYQLALKTEVNKEYYQKLLQGSKDIIAQVLKRKYTYNSVAYSTSGSKADILDKVKVLDREFEAIFYSSVQATDIEKLNRLQGQAILSNQPSSDTMLTIGDFKVSKVHLHELRFENDITVNGMNMILELFRLRDEKIAATFQDFNKVSFQRNLFLGHEDSINALRYVRQVGVKGSLPEWCSKFESVQRIYMAYLTKNIWALIIVDIEMNEIYYINGCLDYDITSTQEIMKNIKKEIVPFLKEHMEDNFNHRWKITAYPGCEDVDYNKLESTSDSGMLITCFIYFSLIRCPIRLIKADLQHARNFFGVSCMNGALPY